MANARAKAEQADQYAVKASGDSEVARLKATEFDPEFHQPGTDMQKKTENGEMEGGDMYDYGKPMQNHVTHQQMAQVGNWPKPDEESLLPKSYIPSGNNPIRNTSGGFDYQNPGLLNTLSPGGKPAVMSNHSPHNRSPSLKIRRYSFLAGSRRGRGFSEIFNSTILNDHFDQYSANRDDGYYVTEDRNFNKMNHITDPSPDSGVSETLDDDKNRPLQRRRTMPSIVKPEETPEQKFTNKESARSTEHIPRKDLDTYVIENGIRKRVQNVPNTCAAPTMGQSKRDLPHPHKIVGQNSLTRQKNRGSLPNISTIKSNDVAAIPREEAFRLGNARRDELRKLQELAERRRQGDVSVILGDIKDFVQQRQLLVLVIAFNLSLATMFFNLLS